MLTGGKMLIQLNSGTARMIRTRLKQCKRHCLSTYPPCPTISNSENMNGKQFHGVFRGRIKWRLLVVVSILFFSCRKVIDVDIEGVERIYVVEAIVADQPGESKVLLYTTTEVSENN